MKYVHLGFSPVRKWQFKSANSVKLSVEAADLLMSNFFQPFTTSFSFSIWIVLSKSQYGKKLKTCKFCSITQGGSAVAF